MRLALYSRAALGELRAATGIQYDRVGRGILHFHTSQAEFEAGARAAEFMRKLGVDKVVKTPDECVALEPALAALRSRLAGATYSASDESGDAHKFTQALAALCAQRGVHFEKNAPIERIVAEGGTVLRVEIAGREPVRAFADESEFIERARRVFDAVDPVLGRQFGVMAEEDLLDLSSRVGKAPGGYCETLPVRGRPYVHMNAVGLLEDVMTLLHEAGHCFHSFAAHEQPLLWQRHPGAEAAELASMSMELLALPFVAHPGGFVSQADAARAWTEHLEDILLTLPHIASVDAFQSWVYTSGEGHDAAARDAAWLRIRARFETGVDWSGLEAERVARWYRQLHIFTYPLYYIEYGIAQVGALQVWRNSLRDPVNAVRAYRNALGLGATRSLPEIYAAAGATLMFDADAMRALVQLVEERINAIRSGLPERR